MAPAMAADIIGFLKPTCRCCPIPTRSIQAKCCGFRRFRTESPRTASRSMNRREDIFDSVHLLRIGGLGLPRERGGSTALRGSSGHDRDSLIGYVRRAPPQPGINTTHDN